MAEDWQERFGTIGANLLSLEVNTVLKTGMVAQKMPEFPVALHTIVELYADYLQACRFPVTEYLLRAAAGRVIDLNKEAERYTTLLESWPSGTDPVPHAVPTTWPSDWRSGDRPLNRLTNGPETFEALQWAAAGALRVEAEREPRQRALLSRVRSNSRQLKEAATLLEKEFSSGPKPGMQTSEETYDARLLSVAGGEDRTPQLRLSRLFGGTIEQTARALFQHPRPTLSIAPDVTVLIRKAWDVGLEEVIFQTVIQLDGDVLVRVEQLADDAQRSFLDALHRRAVDEGTRQWHLLFEVIGSLVGSVGKMIFGPRAT